MKKIFLFLFCLLTVTVFSQSRYVEDTTDLKDITSFLNGFPAMVVSGDIYEGWYRYDTTTSLTPDARTIFASDHGTGFWVRTYQPTENIKVATDYDGIVTTGEIDSTDMYNFLTETSTPGSSVKVIWPDGTYDLPASFANVTGNWDINWEGNGRSTVIKDLSGFMPYGSGGIEIRNMSFKDGGILLRLDIGSSVTTSNHLILEDLYLQNCQMMARNVYGTNVINYDKVHINNVVMDTINSSVSGGAFIQWTVPVKSMYIGNILVQHNTDSNYVTLFRLQGENDSQFSTGDTTFILENIVIKNIITSATNAPAPVTNKLLMSINGEGNDVVVNGLYVYECNLPQLDLRGSPSQITFHNFAFYCPSVVSTATGTDYFLINKSRKTIAGELAFKMYDGYINIGGNLGGAYFENNGDRHIDNVNWTFSSTGNGVRVILSETPTHYNTFKVTNSIIQNISVTGKQTFWFNDDMAYIDFSDSWIGGGENIFGFATTAYQTKRARFENVTFHRGFQTTTQRDILTLELINCNFNGVDSYNFSSKIKTRVIGSSFYDDTTTATTSSVNLNFEFGNATNVDFIGNDFALDSVSQFGNISHTFYANGLDSLRFNNNTGYIRTATTAAVPVRVETIDYLEMIGNNITFPNVNADNGVVYIEAGDTIEIAKVYDNNFNAGGQSIDYFFWGGAGSYIDNLKWGDNSNFDAIEDGNITTTFGNITMHGLIDKDGDSYVTTETSSLTNYWSTTYIPNMPSSYIGKLRIGYRAAESATIGGDGATIIGTDAAYSSVEVARNSTIIGSRAAYGADSPVDTTNNITLVSLANQTGGNIIIGEQAGLGGLNQFGRTMLIGYRAADVTALVGGGVVKMDNTMIFGIEAAAPFSGITSEYFDVIAGGYRTLEGVDYAADYIGWGHDQYAETTHSWVKTVIDLGHKWNVNEDDTVQVAINIGMRNATKSNQITIGHDLTIPSQDSVIVFPTSYEIIGATIDVASILNFSTSDYYTTTQIDSALISPNTEIKVASYELTNSDAGKTIFISGTSTVTLPASLTWEVGQRVEIIRTDGGTITTETSAVTVEYPDNSSAEDSAIVTAAIFIKRADNDYIRIGN